MLELLRYPDVFHIQPDSVELNPAFRDYDERSSKVEAVLKECRSNNVFVALKGWREEVSTIVHRNIYELLCNFVPGFRSLVSRLQPAYILSV
jgi:hypothetical protein